MGNFKRRAGLIAITLIGLVVPAAAQDVAVRINLNLPLEPPPPISIEWAPPALLVEEMPPQPFERAVWVAGYWTWDEGWVWARGEWLAAPMPSYYFVRPYYERRGNRVIFIGGHWGAPGYVFVPPPPSMRIAPAVVRAGVTVGAPPRGPEGVFVPPPPIARHNPIVSSPVGTAPPPAVRRFAPSRPAPMAAPPLRRMEPAPAFQQPRSFAPALQQQRPIAGPRQQAPAAPARRPMGRPGGGAAMAPGGGHR